MVKHCLLWLGLGLGFALALWVSGLGVRVRVRVTVRVRIRVKGYGGLVSGSQGSPARRRVMPEVELASHAHAVEHVRHRVLVGGRR